MSRKKPTVRQLVNSYQSLENRRLLAGNVTVFENVHLYIRGDRADNQFEVVVQDDQLKVVGLNGTTINGQGSFVTETASLTESGVVFQGGLRAHLGSGHDEIAIRDAQFESLSIVYGGTGNDRVDVVDSHFKKPMTIQTFDGDDSVTVHGSQFDDHFRAVKARRT